MTLARQRLGRDAERLAAARLRERGWRIIVRNARTRSGEIDLVCLDGGTLVFVEVKAGRSGSTGGPEAPALAVGRRKQLRLRRLARAWLGDAPRLRFDQLRFDVIGVTVGDGGEVLAFDHIEDAFR